MQQISKSSNYSNQDSQSQKLDLYAMQSSNRKRDVSLGQLHMVTVISGNYNRYGYEELNNRKPTFNAKA